MPDLHEVLRALIHPDHQDRHLSPAAQAALYATCGPLDADVHTGGLHYRVRAQQPTGQPPTVTARRVTPPRPGEVIIRAAVRADHHGVAGALIGTRTVTARVGSLSPGMLYARAAYLALTHAPDGPLTLLSPHPVITRLLRDIDPRAREHQHLQQALRDRTGAVHVHLITKAAAHALHFSDRVMGHPTRPAAEPTSWTDLTVHVTAQTVHAQWGDQRAAAPHQAHIPAVLSGLHALLPVIPPGAGVRAPFTPAAHAAYTNPDLILGPDAHLVQDIRRVLTERHIRLRIH